MKGQEIIEQITRGEMPDREQVRANCVRQFEPDTAAKYNVWAKRLVPLAVCVIIALVFVFATGQNGLIQKPRPLTPEAAPAPEIALNEFSAQYDGGVSNLFNLSWDDFIAMDRQELNDFYGVNVFPSVVPADMVLPGERNTWGIYKRNAGKDEIYWAQNSIVYSNAIGYTDEGATILPKGANERSLSIGVAKEKPFSQVDFRDYMEGTAEKSVINSNDVLIGHYISENGQYEYYYASFVYHDVDFLVTGCNFSLAEFSDAVTSILER
jgi:hypothetical protein